MLIIAITTYLLNLFDMLCTLHLAKEYGDDIEGNPIGKVLLKSKPITIIVKVVMAVPLWLLYVMESYLICKVILWGFFGIYVALTVYHIIIILYLKKHDL